MAAWFWLIAWGLWWLVVILGAQGTSPILAIIGLLSLPALLTKRPDIPLDLLAFILFLVWCVTTSFWGPGAENGVFIFDFENQNIAIRAPGLRLVLTASIALFAFWACLQFKPEMYARGVWAARLGVGLIFAFFAACLINWSILINLGNALSSDTEVTQNIVRAANLLVLSLPVCIALFRPKNGLVLALGIVLPILIAGLLALKTGADAALIAIPFASLIAGLTYVFGRRMFHVLTGLTIVLVVTMPLIVGGVLKAADAKQGSTIPLSFQSRLDTFDYVSDKLSEKWMFGWGVEASREWKEKHAVTVNGQTVQYRIVPGHPHNMPLQVWAETGLVGALLLAISIGLFGHRLYKRFTDEEDKLTLCCSTALWATGLVFALVSYKVWNDAYWTSILFLATGLIAVRRTAIAN